MTNFATTLDHALVKLHILLTHQGILLSFLSAHMLYISVCGLYLITHIFPSTKKILYRHRGGTLAAHLAACHQLYNVFVIITAYFVICKAIVVIELHYPLYVPNVILNFYLICTDAYHLISQAHKNRMCHIFREQVDVNQLPDAIVKLRQTPFMQSISTAAHVSWVSRRISHH